MKLQNSYIFIPNPYRKEDSLKNKNSIRIDLRIKVYIENLFDLKDAECEGDGLYNSIIDCNMTIENNLFNVIFIINKVAKYTYLDVQVKEKRKTQIIQCLEYIHNELLQSNIQNDYIMIVSYDSISEYYCNKIYPKLNELERNIRKLFFNIYVANFGCGYYQATISDELQAKIKAVIQAKGNKQKKEIERLQQFFYCMEFIDIINLLFTKRWTSVEEKAKADFLKNNNKLTELSEEKLRNAFDRFAPKNDWERFFNNKISDVNVHSLLETIRDNRNDIAHCKFFYKEQYINSSKAIEELNKAIFIAIKLTEEKDFVNKNMKYFESSLARLSATFLKFNKIMLSLNKKDL